MLPDISFPIVDVGDVATMHRMAFETEAAAGQRFPAVAGAMTMLEMAETLNAEIPQSRAKTRKAPSWLVKAMAMVNSDMKTIAPRLGKSGAVSGRNAEEKLGITFTSPRDTLLASARYLVETGRTAER
jgi:dihydroflavonol-4-reductase